MRRGFIVSFGVLLIVLAAGLSLVKCGKKAIPDLSSSSAATYCPTKSGDSLCGYCESSGFCRYCPSPYVCSFTDVCSDLKCAASSGNGTINSTTQSSTSSGGTGSSGSTVATNCTCNGNLQCSQKVGCLQSCACYTTINGSDASTAWYRVGTGPNGTGTCYMCDQNGLSPSCTNAANAAAQAVTSIIAGGGSCL